jgi:hypothetical protein
MDVDRRSRPARPLDCPSAEPAAGELPAHLPAQQLSPDAASKLIAQLQAELAALRAAGQPADGAAGYRVSDAAPEYNQDPSELLPAVTPSPAASPQQPDDLDRRVDQATAWIDKLSAKVQACEAQLREQRAEAEETHKAWSTVSHTQNAIQLRVDQLLSTPSASTQQLAERLTLLQQLSADLLTTEALQQSTHAAWRALEQQLEATQAALRALQQQRADCEKHLARLLDGLSDPPPVPIPSLQPPSPGTRAARRDLTAKLDAAVAAVDLSQAKRVDNPRDPRVPLHGGCPALPGSAAAASPPPVLTSHGPAASPAALLQNRVALPTFPLPSLGRAPLETMLERPHGEHEMDRRESLPLLPKGVSSLLTKPATFSGEPTQRVKLWLKQLQSLLETISAPPATWATVGEAQLRDSAFEYWDHYKQAQLPDAGPISWAAFSDALLARFHNANEVDEARSKLDTLAQGSSTAQQYTHAFEQNCRLIPDITEAQKVHYYRKGLSPFLRNRCSFNPTTAKDWESYQPFSEFVLMTALRAGAARATEDASKPRASAAQPSKPGKAPQAGHKRERDWATRPTQPAARAAAGPDMETRPLPKMGVGRTLTRHKQFWVEAAAQRVCANCLKPGHSHTDCTSGSAKSSDASWWRPAGAGGQPAAKAQRK